MANVSYPKLHKAVRWASKLHEGQDRDGEAPLPYLTHVLEVVSNLRFVGNIKDEEMLCAAALHDVVEQSGVAFSKIEEKFGKKVRKLVQEMTRREPTAKETKGLNVEEIWKLRSKMLLEEINKMSPAAQQLKLADRLSNVRNAVTTKLGGKLHRTLHQTHEILKIIPREVNPHLWDAIKRELTEAKIAETAVVDTFAKVVAGKPSKKKLGASLS